MFQFTCPGCAAHCAVADAERVGELCTMCAARQIWEALPPETQHAIDAAIRRGPIAGLAAMSETTPPIRMPLATDLLAFRHQAGPPTPD
jgi:hypothetical protein